ncbi:hypothetical protein SXCC_04711 [Gluconacetobacter sp. SXCC-1]|nr:hypothetical protein SXCC_04711 [Gluconacetobacter sp. SXCC-1]
MWQPSCGICFGVVDADAIYARVTAGVENVFLIRSARIRGNARQARLYPANVLSFGGVPKGNIRHLDLGITTVEK